MCNCEELGVEVVFIGYYDHRGNLWEPFKNHPNLFEYRDILADTNDLTNRWQATKAYRVIEKENNES